MSPVTIDGPTPHPMLGTVVGVDFSPKKVCSFDCIYCGVGMNTTKKTMEREMFHPVGDVLEAIARHVEEHGTPDTFFLTGSGEPMLYSGFGEMAAALKETYPDASLTVYTNGSLLTDQNVRREIAQCDPIQGNLDTVDERTFLRLSRPHRDASLRDRLDGYRMLKDELTGQRLWLHGVFVKGESDDPKGLRALGEVIAEIDPDLCVVRTTRRTIEGLCEPVDAGFRTVVERAWDRFDFPVRYSLPEANSDSDRTA
jgi:wyosine [tRNA(Phe)-imidazoG37] synthetase (radical SAM superfamily)